MLSQTCHWERVLMRTTLNMITRSCSFGRVSVLRKWHARMQARALRSGMRFAKPVGSTLTELLTFLQSSRFHKDLQLCVDLVCSSWKPGQGHLFHTSEATRSTTVVSYSGSRALALLFVLAAALKHSSMPSLYMTALCLPLCPAILLSAIICCFATFSQDLSLGRLASSLGLLRLPHMPEVKKALMAQPSGGSAGCLEHFSPSPVDIEAVKFKDKAREKQRQKVHVCVCVRNCKSVVRVFVCV
eukprot:62450-Pelagomonas_calceolata.AAC.6